MENKKRTLILDVDTGSDDAVMLIAAVLSGRFDVLGITTVCGSEPIDAVVTHTLMTLELLGADIPVYKGCGEPMARDLYDKGLPLGASRRIQPPERVSGGFHDVFQSLPAPKLKPQPMNGVSYLLDALRGANSPIELVATGALTNLGCALRVAPELARSIRRIVIMGGGIDITNKTSAAEGNFWRDPEAAKIVLDSGADIVLVPLDTTHKTAFSSAELRKIESIGTPASEFVASVVRVRMNAYNKLQPLGEADLAILHDLMCIMLLLDPDVIRNYHTASVSVSLDHGESAGQMIVDRRFMHGKENAVLALEPNAERFHSMLIDLLANRYQ